VVRIEVHQLFVHTGQKDHVVTKRMKISL
jgi:hypothetical protein